MAQVRIGTKMYDANQTFMAEIDSVAGPVQLTAAQAAAMYNNTNSYSMGNTTQAGMLQSLTPNAPPPKPKAPAAAPAPAPRAAPKKSVLSEPPPPAFQQTQPTQQERDEVTPPASGLEDTIKTSPSLLRERRKRSYLTSA
jgi:hypothetical protein